MITSTDFSCSLNHESSCVAQLSTAGRNMQISSDCSANIFPTSLLNVDEISESPQVTKLALKNPRFLSLMKMKDFKMNMLRLKNFQVQQLSVTRKRSEFQYAGRSRAASLDMTVELRKVTNSSSLLRWTTQSYRRLKQKSRSWRLYRNTFRLKFRIAK